MEKISACLVVYNEEKLIGRCLESLKGAVDEIIVVHDGPCQDRTLEIAAEYGAKIFVRPHVGEAEEHRPFSFAQAACEWILQIDADEFLAPELKIALSKLTADVSVDAYEFIWPLWDGEGATSSTWPYKRCFFRKYGISYLGIPHYVLAVSGITKKINLKLEHQPSYNNYSYLVFLKKQLPWARLQASYYFKDFSIIEKFNYSDDDWPDVIRRRKKFPLLLLPAEFLITVFKNIFSGAYRAGCAGLKASLFAGAYRVAVNYYIYQLKK